MFKKFLAIVVSFFLISTFFASNSHAFPAPLRTSAENIEGSTCKNLNVEKVVKGKVFVCTKVGKSRKWRFSKTADLDFFSQEKTLLLVKESLSIVPQGEANTLFTVNQRFLPELGQSFMVESPLHVTDLVIKPNCVTRVPLEYYSGQNQDHSLESFSCNNESFDVDVTVSFLKISPEFSGDPFIRKVSDMNLVSRSVHSQTLTTGSDLVFNFGTPVSLTEGFYMVIFGFIVHDPLVNTIWFVGHEHSSPDLASCVSNPSSDVYALGSAYRSEPAAEYTGLADNFRGFSDVFEHHYAKVNSCIVVGNFGPPVTAPGDIFLDIFFTRS